MRIIFPFLSIACLALLDSVNGFNTVRERSFGTTKPRFVVYSSAGSIPEESPAIKRARENVLQIATECFDNSPSGVFIPDSLDKDRLRKAVAELEALCGVKQYLAKDLVGDWKLVCTTNTAGLGLNVYNALSSERKGMLNLPFQRSTKSLIQKYLRVMQRIRSFDANITSTVAFDRVDNVIEIVPPPVIETIIEEATSLLSGTSLIKDYLPIILNPLNVTKSKLTLAHKATIESEYPLLRTKISLQSVIRKSQFYVFSCTDICFVFHPYFLLSIFS